MELLNCIQKIRDGSLLPKLRRKRQPLEDGVASFQVEGRAPVLDENISQREASFLRELQLDPDRPHPEDTAIRKLASTACAKCPGFCCRAFTLDFKKSDIPKLLREKYEQMRELILAEETHANLMQFHEGGKVLGGWTRDGVARAEELLDMIDNLEFFRHRLIPVGSNGGRKNAWQKGYVYGCSEFNKELRRCMAYDKRPKICRKYICGAASVGQVPLSETMEAGINPKIAEEIGKENERISL